MKLRQNEVKLNPIRWPLFYETRQGYYFMTREGVDFGPYKSLNTAKYGRQLFIYEITGDIQHQPHPFIDYKAILPIQSVELKMPKERVA